MPVDFTKENKKTNEEYLRELINGNEEANEFLDGIVAEHSTDISHLNHRINTLEEQLDEEVEEAEYANSISTGYGNEDLKWQCGNIAVDSMMEELGEAIGRGVPVQKIENVLRSL